MLSSRFGMAITITHFHICTQSAPEQASQNSSTPKERSFKDPPLSEMLLAITTTGEGRIILPQGNSLWYHVLMNGPMPIHIWTALNGLIGCLKREREYEVWGEICWKTVQKLHGEGYDHNPLYTCMNF